MVATSFLLTLLLQANSGANTNGCQFFITLGRCEWLNGKHVVFGKVLDQASLQVVRKLEQIPTGQNDKPKFQAIIEECGEM